MPVLPALISRPLSPAPPAPPAGPDLAGALPFLTVTQELSAGLPTRIDLDAGRRLVLAVPLGVARAVITADPSAVVFDSAALDPPDPAALRDGGAAWPRLTLVLADEIGQTMPVLPGVAGRLTGPDPAVAVVEVTVDRLVITAGTLRSPGRFGSRLTLRWRDLSLGLDAGPASGTGDPSIPPAREEQN
jgi:hypothetical protein